MNKYHRNGLSASQEAKVEETANPRTFKQLEEALKNPNSPAYKSMMAMLMEQVAIHVIIEKLIHQFIEQRREASRQEKEALTKELIAASIRVSEQLKLYTPQYYQVVPYKQPELAVAEKLLITLPNEIGTLKQSMANHYKELTAIHDKQAANTATWPLVLENSVEKLLKDKTIILQGPDGPDPKGPLGKDIIARAMSSVPPVKLMKVVAQSNLDYHASKTPTIKIDPLAPPPPPPPLPPSFDSKQVGNKGLLNIELRLAAEIVERLTKEDGTAPSILQVLKLNRPLFEEVSKLDAIKAHYTEAAGLQEKQLDHEGKLAHESQVLKAKESLFVQVKQDIALQKEPPAPQRRPQ